MVSPVAPLSAARDTTRHRGDALRMAVVRAVLGFQNAILWLVVRALFQHRRAHAAAPARVLVYRTARLGDFINALPALAAIRARFPKAKIALLTTPSTDPASGNEVAKSLDGALTFPWTQFAYPRYVD